MTGQRFFKFTFDNSEHKGVFTKDEKRIIVLLKRGEYNPCVIFYLNIYYQRPNTAVRFP